MKLPFRRQAATVLVLIAVLILTACTANASSTPKRSIPENLTGKKLCDVVRSTLAPAALPGVKLGPNDPTDQLTYHECLLGSAGSARQVVGIIVAYGKWSLSDSMKINKGLTDSSKNSKEQCPGGATVPTVSAGLPAETTLICNRKLTSLVNYKGLTKAGSITITVDRAISKGKISAGDVQSWLDAVAAKLLVSTAATTSTTSNETLKQISDNWSGPAIPTGFRLSGPQKKIKTIQSVQAAIAEFGNDPCQVVTAGVPIQSSDKASDSSFEFLQTLVSTDSSRANAVLFASARVFDSHQDAMSWVSNLNSLVAQCESKENIGAGFFTVNSKSLIRWSGNALRSQLFSGFILVAGDAVFYGNAVAQADEPSQPDYDSWLAAAEQSCRDSVS